MTYSVSELLSWSTANDDGSGVLGGQQHGVTQTITTCDGDDPACTFQTSPDGYLHGKWLTNINTEGKMEVCACVCVYVCVCVCSCVCVCVCVCVLYNIPNISCI